MLAKRVVVTVRRNPMESISKVIYAHEVPCLMAKFGDRAVSILDNAPEGMSANDIKALKIPVKLDANTEWSRLENIYGFHPEFALPTVGYVYQNNKQALVDFNLDKYLANMVSHDANEQPLDDPHAPSDEDEGNADADIEEMKRRLDALDVTYGAKAKLETLAGKLRDALELKLASAGVLFELDESLESLWFKLPAPQLVGEE